MTLTATTDPAGAVLPVTSSAPPRRGRLRRATAGITEARVFFALTLPVYLALAVRQTLTSGVWYNDALVRLSNSQNVLTSSDPHLAGIGFTFGPIPSFVLLPFMPFAAFWPELTTKNVLGTSASAFWMAGSVALCCLTLRALGVPRLTRLLLTLVYAANPLIIIFGSNGMSEAPLLFFLMGATLGMVRYLGGSPHPARDLLYSSLMVSGAYLTRFEALFAGISLLILVPVVAWLRAPSTRRRIRARMDLVLFGLPFLSVVVVWSITTKVIVGDWIGYLSADYGQGAGTADGGAREVNERVGGTELADRLGYLGEQTFALAPLLIAIMVGALVLIPVRRDLRQIAPVATMGAVAVAAGAAFMINKSSGLLRYDITIVPLAVLLAGSIAGSRRLSSAVEPVRGAAGSSVEPVHSEPSRPQVPWYRSRAALGALALLGIDAVAGALALALAAPGLVTTVALVQDRTLATQEARYLEFLRDPADAVTREGRDVNSFGNQRAAAAFVDRLGAGRGTILTDSAVNASILAFSSDREAYLATSDRLFERAVADPLQFGVEYVLIATAESARFDAVRARFPQLVEGRNEGVAVRIASFGEDNPLVLYKLRQGLAPQSDIDRAG